MPEGTKHISQEGRWVAVKENFDFRPTKIRLDGIPEYDNMPYFSQLKRWDGKTLVSVGISTDLYQREPWFEVYDFTQRKPDRIYRPLTEQELYNWFGSRGFKSGELPNFHQAYERAQEQMKRAAEFILSRLKELGKQVSAVNRISRELHLGDIINIECSDEDAKLIFGNPAERL